MSTSRKTMAALEKLSAGEDGELSQAELNRLGQSGVLSQDEIEATRLEWARIRARLREEVRPPVTPESAAADVMRRIRILEDRSESATTFSNAWTFFPRWALALAAVAILGAAGWFLLGPDPMVQTAFRQPGAAKIEWVESPDSEGASMIYEDADSGWAVVWVEVEEIHKGNGDA